MLFQMVQWNDLGHALELGAGRELSIFSPATLDAKFTNKIFQD